MKTPKLDGSIGYGDDEKVHAFAENKDGDVLTLHSEPVNWQGFDTPMKAKESAALICRNLAAIQLRELAEQFDNGKIIPELT